MLMSLQKTVMVFLQRTGRRTEIVPWQSQICFASQNTVDFCIHSTRVESSGVVGYAGRYRVYRRNHFSESGKSCLQVIKGRHKEARLQRELENNVSRCLIQGFLPKMTLVVSTVLITN